jgi:hypothetical protein
MCQTQLLSQEQTAVNGAFSSWKLKATLKKKSTGPKAIFSLADGKYSLKSA